ncbi:hypothetical protein HDU93_000689 [Gonapodya sp. JEL0774]|nr:hypothetical protein HDU93_000689 [Gonapodya sp. JEL0774]
MNLFKKEPESAKKKKEYEIGEIVGKGAYGVVKEAIHLPTKRKVAIKVIEKSILAKERKNFTHVQAEFGILSSVKHPNVIQFIDWFETKEKYYLVYELAIGGELFKRIVSVGHFSERECVIVISTILNAIVYLHSHGLVHRDLKPENLLFKDSSEDSSIVIVDFGVAKLVGDGESEGNIACKTFTGSPAYMAPEVVLRKKYGKPVDVWSVGVIAFVLLSGHSPWGDKLNANEVYRRIAEARPTAHEALHHPWLEKLCPKGYLEYIERFNVAAWKRENRPIREHVIPQWNHVSADPRTASVPIRNASSTSSIASSASSVNSTCHSSSGSASASTTTLVSVSNSQSLMCDSDVKPAPLQVLPRPLVAMQQTGIEVTSPALPNAPANNPLRANLQKSQQGQLSTDGAANGSNTSSQATLSVSSINDPITESGPQDTEHQVVLHPHSPVALRSAGMSSSQASRIKFAEPSPIRTPSPAEHSGGENAEANGHEAKYSSFGKVLGRARRLSLKQGELNLFREAVSMGATYGLGGEDDLDIGDEEDLNAADVESEETDDSDPEASNSAAEAGMGNDVEAKGILTSRTSA